MIQYTNKELCSQCGGKCCKDESCLYAPEDFEEITFETMLKAYKEGRVMFTCIHNEEGKVTSILVRPPMEGCSQIDLYANEQGRCKFLTSDGCKYDYYHRPRGGKLTIPIQVNGRMRCECKYSVEIAAKEWKDYGYLLDDLIRHVMSEDIKKEDRETIDHLQCKVCGGKCCKETGCMFSPHDFRYISSFEKMRNLLAQGFISIVSIYPMESGLDEPIRVLKMRNKYAKVLDDRPDLANGGCIALESDGCPFTDEDRPYGGRILIPEKAYGKTCSRGYSHRKAAEDWLPYQELVDKLSEEFAGKTVKFEGVY